MKTRMIWKCGVVSLWVSVTAIAQDDVIRPADPAAAEAKILGIFESKLETHPEFLTELLAENRDRAERLLRAAQKKRFARFVLSKKRNNMATPVTVHFIDCTMITDDYSVLYELPGWDRKKYGPQGWGEVLWSRNGRVVHFDRIDRFATIDELVAKTAALVEAGEQE